MRQCSIRGSARSSAKRVWPVTFARASTRRAALPTLRSPVDDASGGALAAAASEGAPGGSSSATARPLPHTSCGLLDGLEDLDVARAAAEDARERVADLVARRIGALVEEGPRGEQHRWRAVAALRGAEVRERLL